MTSLSAIRRMSRTILTSPLHRYPSDIGSARAWDAGYDGRLVLDPLCAAVPDLLAPGGTFLVVQSEFAVPRQTLAALAEAGLDAEVVAYQWIPFGPVLSSRAAGWRTPAGWSPAGARKSSW